MCSFHCAVAPGVLANWKKKTQIRPYVTIILQIKRYPLALKLIVIINRSRRILMKDVRKKSITSTRFRIRLRRSYRDASDISGLDNVIGNIAPTYRRETRDRLFDPAVHIRVRSYTADRGIRIAGAYLSSRHSPITENRDRPGIRRKYAPESPAILLHYWLTCGTKKFTRVRRTRFLPRVHPLPPFKGSRTSSASDKRSAVNYARWISIFLIFENSKGA